MIKQTKPHVLIVDDDQQIRTMLARFLGEHGMRVTQASEGISMFKVMETGRFDVIVLDVMMPGEDGFTLCRKLRAESAIPLILLTARNSETDRIVGLELGADDYVTKPFNPRELLARIRALLRRANAQPQAVQRLASATYQFAGWTLDTSRRSLLSPQGVLTDLTTGEFDLLVAFVEHPQRVLNRDQLLDLARGRVSLAFDRSIDVQVSRLRRKIETDPNAPALIKTVRNGGYFFTALVISAGQVALP
ncbi:response regulator [Aestuariivirga sp. YIM B02566]|uniref:Response regulator n=1 Tax=Taklimakanibacter albus TaxID=2800327 RepID=A0ACC5QY16_9HYPH|nr:response regulator [Aestuariivirga sp. YIM B02566]MBK1865284.1 response regulator [Aestuariivirga sp. YIM B02566]